MASNILRTPYTDRQTSETRECAVCLNERLDPCRTSCGHFFCEECLRAALKPWKRGRCPLCRARVSLYDTVKADLTTPLEKPAVDTIFGSAFLQNGRPGVAAYHFDSIEDCYISYENAPSSWKLANGEKPPARKPFDNPVWDPATRTFTATVDWSANAFGGAARWEYTMVFSDDFAFIAGGACRSFDADGQSTRVSTFPIQLQYIRAPTAPTTIFGSRYVQFGRLGLASYHFRAADDCYISYEDAPPSWRLDDGAPPPPVKPFDSPSWDAATRTFTGVIDWSANPFHGNARWEYTIVFSEDFREISGGEVRAFDAAGELVSTHRYGQHLRYKLYVEEMAQLLNHLRDSARAESVPVTYSVGRWRR